MDGRSLLPLLDGGPAEDAATAGCPTPAGTPSCSASRRPVTITTAEYAYVYWPGGDGARSELYHLPSDARQTRNVIAGQRQLADELRREYLAWARERNPEVAGWIEQVERDPEWRPDAERAWKGMV